MAGTPSGRRDLPGAGWTQFRLWLAFGVLFLVLQGLVAFLLSRGHGGWAVPIVLLLGHLMHVHLLALHEAAHGHLCPDRRLNEAAGVLIGTLALMSFQLFRTVHSFHHAHLGTERDEELWPLVHPSAPRGARRLAAALELSLALFYTPALFLRAFVRRNSRIRSGRIRRRIRLELLLMALVWSGVLGVTLLTGGWLYLAVLYLVPAMLAGNMQSLRKYIEHLGMVGDSVFSLSRSIVPRGRLERLVVWSMFYEPYHGIHHREARLPGVRLPDHLGVLKAAPPDAAPAYPSFLPAFRDMVRRLPDPHVGPQWRGHGDSRRASCRLPYRRRR